MSNLYRELFMEIFKNPGELSSAKMRAKPLLGQGFPTYQKVSCNSGMREKAKPGTIIRIIAKEANVRIIKDYLYANPNWEWNIVSRKEAEKRIKALGPFPNNI